MLDPVVIVKTGSTLPDLRTKRGDYEDWIADSLGLRTRVVDVVEGEHLPDPATCRGVVVTGSSAMVTERAPWSERTARWLVTTIEQGTPLLAICYGHQLLADALGGEVGPAPTGRQIGMIEIALTDAAAEDPLFEGLPPAISMSSSHRQSVLRLPNGARRLAEDPADPHQAFAVGERAWGVQFHPEWDHEVMRFYLESRREVLRDEGLDPDELLRRVRPSEDGPNLIRRFGELL